jgi:hypothetical protein
MQGDVFLERMRGRLLAPIGGSVTRGIFRDIQKHGSISVFGLIVAADRPDKIERLIRALELLKQRRPGAFRAVTRWIQRVAVVEQTRFTPPSNWCDGTVLIKSWIDYPDNVLAAYFYRLAVEVMLYRRFGFTEVASDSPRCQLVGLRIGLKVMRKLECSETWIEEHMFFINEMTAKIYRWRGCTQGSQIKGGSPTG